MSLQATCPHTHPPFPSLPFTKNMGDRRLQRQMAEQGAVPLLEACAPLKGRWRSPLPLIFSVSAKEEQQRISWSFQEAVSSLEIKSSSELEG